MYYVESRMPNSCVCLYLDQGLHYPDAYFAIFVQYIYDFSMFKCRYEFIYLCVLKLYTSEMSERLDVCCSQPPKSYKIVVQAMQPGAVLGWEPSHIF